MQETQRIWDNIIDYLQNEMKIAPSIYTTFVRDCKPAELTSSKFIIQVPSTIHKDYWEKNLQTAVIITIYDKTEQTIEPEFVLENEYVSPQLMATKNNTPQTFVLPAKRSKEEIVLQTGLRENYIFDTFVVGDGSRFAYAASLAVANDPGQDYNPLFIYGGVGLGKTHLMQAIGHEMIEKNPHAKIKYVTSEMFMNDFVNSIRHNRADEFQEEYRSLDLLMVDDVQFFNKFGKDSEASKTQEAFFNTFNALHGNGKQVILTSDRTPKELQNLEDRLISRFEWGMSVDIIAPDFETRFAILKNKAESDMIDIPEESLKYIASQFSDNVRELEGALRRVHFYATSKGEEISTQLTAEAISGLKGAISRNNNTSIDEIQKIVCNFYSITLAELKGGNRTKKLVIPRQIAMFLSKEMTNSSYPLIAAKFGGKDHSTVMYAVKKIKGTIENGENDEMRKEIDKIKQKLS